MKRMHRIPKKAIARNVLAYLLTYFEENGFMPTLFEISERFNYTREWARLMVQELERQGRVVVEPHKPRGIKLTRPN